MKKSYLTGVNFLVSVILLLVVLLTSIRCDSGTSMREYFDGMLQKIDKVQIQYFNGDDTLTAVLTKRDQVDIYRELINGKEERDLKCDSTGRIRYFFQDTLQFEAYFSTPATGSKYKNGVLVYFFKPDIYKTLFTYRAGMGVDEFFHELKQKR